MNRLRLYGVISVAFLLAPFCSSMATDSSTLCKQPYEIEDQCAENAPQTLALLIAGTEDPKKALNNTVIFWSSKGQFGRLFAAEILRLVNQQSSFRSETFVEGSQQLSDRNELIKLCILEAAKLCEQQAKGKITNYDSFASSRSPDSSNKLNKLQTDEPVINPDNTEPTSPTTCQPIIGQSTARLLSQPESTTKDLLSQGIATCYPEKCAVQFTNIFSNNDDKNPFDALLSRRLNRDEIAKQCLGLTSQYPWQDEDNPKSGGPKVAYNCRDAAMAFIFCMRQKGVTEEELFRVHIWCKNCASSDPGHALVMYRRDDGYFCPAEPSQPLDGSANNLMQGCCLPTKSEAAKCAEERFCGRGEFKFMCCEPRGYPKIFPPKDCPKESSYCTDKHGKYTCSPDPANCIPEQKKLTPCERAMKFCFDNSDPSVDRCKECSRCKMCPSFWNCLFG